MPRYAASELHSGSDQKTRLVWLDVLRVLCALQIVGFHWLRAAVKTGHLAQNHADNLILNYRQLDFGVIEGAKLLDVEKSQGTISHRWLVDIVAGLFTFGWEAVFVFVLLSGVALSISLDSKWRSLPWRSWMKRRLERILIPYYLVAIVVSMLMYAGLAFTASGRSAGIKEIHEKIMTLTGSNIAGILWSQLLLINPHQRFWTATFLAPAWWFVPAILLAYALFPFYMWLLSRLGRFGFLSLGAAVSITSYQFMLHLHVQEFSWWFVICNECFDFFAGILIGLALATPRGKQSIEGALGSTPLVAGAVFLVLTGSLCNLYRSTYAISSLLFTIPLAFCGSALSRRIQRWRPVNSLLRVDSFHLYLVHQPLAFPIMVASEILLGRFAVVLGLPLYFGACIGTTFLFSSAVKRLQVKLASAGRSVYPH